MNTAAVMCMALMSSIPSVTPLSLSTAAASGVMRNSARHVAVCLVKDFSPASVGRRLSIWQRGVVWRRDVARDLPSMPGRSAMDVRDAILQALDEVRPALQAAGGDVELLEVHAADLVRVRLTGVCRDCPAQESTLLYVVQRALQERAPYVRRVVLG